MLESSCSVHHNLYTLGPAAQRLALNDAELHPDGPSLKRWDRFFDIAAPLAAPEISTTSSPPEYVECA